VVDCVHLDIETYSECDLKKTGAYVYAAHPSTELLCFAYSFGKEPVRLWLPYQPLPARLVEHIKLGREVRAHNAQYERVQLNGEAGRKVGFPHLKIEQMVCTAAKARAHGLPGKLKDCAKALGTHPKDDAGHTVMLQLSKPRRGKEKRWTPDNTPEKFQILYNYCIDDVLAERDIDNAIPDLSPYEQRIWQLDQEINDRGVGVDLETVADAQALVDAYKAELYTACEDITGYGPTQFAEVTEWVRANGYPQLPNMQAETVLECLDDPACPDNVKRVLRVCSTHNMKAVSKFKPMMRSAGEDARIRGMFLMYGAGPGRWSSSIVQLQNMARPKIDDVDTAIECFKHRDLDLIKFLWDDVDPMTVIASCTRGMLVGQNNKVIQALDFAGIESRWTAWMFDELWKIEAFEKSDRGEGPDTYRVSYGSMFGVDPMTIDKKDMRRQIGKVVELAFGYEGGVGACVTAAKTYQLDLEELCKQALPALTDKARESAEWMWNNFEVPRGRPSSLPYEMYIACDGLKQSWRMAHPNIKAGWRMLLDCAKEAVRNPGVIYALPNNKIRFKVEGDFLYMRLPSGRKIAYYKPELKEIKTTKTNKDGSTYEHVSNALTYMGIDTKTRQWKRTATYGGRLTENAAQGGSSDLLRCGMLNLHEAGYPLIMTVHDEVCAEIEPDFQSLEEAEQIFIRKPEWAAGLPLAAEGFRAERYRK
jgi:DNA polymerase bacteriophage-type